ncbi:MAG: PA0069 family radical SAM protein [Granulosicoccus sp.]
MHNTPRARRGRGAQSNSVGRFEPTQRIDVNDGWQSDMAEESSLQTLWYEDRAKTVISRNQSPDIHFDQSINPYRGCEHGCIYCFARPSHTYLGHSAGLDFERLLYVKKNAALLLRNELAKRSYQCKPIAIGVNTDAYQPLERTHKITRQLLEVLLECRHPVYMITKSSLIERDIDLLQEFARLNLVTAAISLTTLDNKLAHLLEPRASAPHRRLRTMQTLAAADIPVRVSMSPIIPALNEPEIDRVMKESAEHGATMATCLLLRLPHELATLFPEWLNEHYPLRSERILKAIRMLRGDKNQGNDLNDSSFGQRFSGTGPRADLIQQTFRLACKRYGLKTSHSDDSLDTTLFKAPKPLDASGQQDLF